MNCYKVGDAEIVHFSPLANLAVQIEPSDSTLFPGLALFAHRRGEQLAQLGPTPSLRLEALFSLGDKPEKTNCLARRRLDAVGYENTQQYLRAVCLGTGANDFGGRSSTNISAGYPAPRQVSTCRRKNTSD